MIEIIIVTKGVIARIIRRVDIDEFYLTAELFFKRVQGQQVIALDNQVFFDRAFFIPFDFRYLLFAINSVSFEPGQHLRVKQSINLILRENFIEKDFFAFFFLPGLPAFQHAVFIRPDEGHLTSFTQEFTINVQTDFIAKTGI